MEQRETYGMVVTPHPDDAEIGMGGTVARWTREKGDVVYVVCTSGEKGTRDRSITQEALAKTREREQLAAARKLGVRDVVFLRFPDQALEDTSDFRKELVKAIRTYRPEVVATTDPYRRFIWHRDHRIVGQAVLDAVYPYARDHLAYPDLLDEGFEPHKVREVFLWGSEEPNYIVDITPYFKTKIEALRCHESQLVSWTDWEKWIRERSLNAAKGKAFKFGEAFFRIKTPL